MDETSWQPLIKVLLATHLPEWVHMGTTDLFGVLAERVEQYRHAVTGRDLYVSHSGRCYVLEDGDFVVVEPASALEMARVGAEQMDGAGKITLRGVCYLGKTSRVQGHRLYSEAFTA